MTESPMVYFAETTLWGLFNHQMKRDPGRERSLYAKFHYNPLRIMEAETNTLNTDNWSVI